MRSGFDSQQPERKQSCDGVWYNGITHGWGSCNPGSTPGTPNEAILSKIASEEPLGYARGKMSIREGLSQGECSLG